MQSPPIEKSLLTSTVSVWKEALALWFSVVQRGWIWLLFTGILSSFLDFFLEYVKRVDERLALVLGIFGFVFGLFIAAFSTIIISQIVKDIKNKRESPLMLALSDNLSPVFIETTRAVVPILLKFLLLVVPGIIEMVRLWFVAYIAQFDDDYKAGKVDALQRSRELVQGRFWEVTWILLLTTALSMVPALWRGGFSLGSQPVFYGLALSVCVFAEAYAETVVYLKYERLDLELRIRNAHPISLPGTPQS